MLFVLGLTAFFFSISYKAEIEKEIANSETTTEEWVSYYVGNDLQHSMLVTLIMPEHSMHVRLIMPSELLLVT